MREQDGLRLFRAEARLDGREDGPIRVCAGDDVILAERVVLDTGTRSLRPPVDGLDQVPLIDVESWIGLREPPRRLVFLGGGTITLEMAQTFRRFGAEVAIVQQGPSSRSARTRTWRRNCARRCCARGSRFT